LLVGGILGDVLDGLGVGLAIPLVSQCTSPGAEAIAKLALLHAHVRTVVALVDSEVFQGSAAGLLGGLAGVEGDAAELVAEGGGEGAHDLITTQDLLDIEKRGSMRTDLLGFWIRQSRARP
jgi:hypothetical protein